jgi:hypothetical protein
MQWIFVAALTLAGEPDFSGVIRWEAPRDCPTEEDVRMRVDQMLAAGGSGHREAVQLRMKVRGTPTGYRLDARLFDSDGPMGDRALEAAHCDELANAAVLIAAIAIDPDLVPPSLEPSDPQPPPPEQQKPPPTAPSPQPSPTKDRRRHAYVVQLGAGIGFGRLAAPRPMALARVSAGVELGWFRGLARFSGFGPSVGTIEGRRAEGIFGAGTGGVAACGRTMGTTWSFVGCLATDVGVAAGRGRNVQTPRTNRSLWWGLEVEAGVEYALTPQWSLAARADAAVTPLRTNFIVDGQGYPCCERWGAGLRLGVLTRFGR